MKKYTVKKGIFCLFILLIVLLFGGMAGVNAVAESEGEEKLNENIVEQLGQLDLQALQEYLDSLGNFTNECVA